MVALLHPHSGSGVRARTGGVSSGAGPSRLRLVVDNTPGAGPVQEQVRDRRSASAGSVGRLVGSFDVVTVALLVAAAIAVFGGLLWVRVMQGGATADTWEGVSRSAGQSVADASAGPVAVDAGARTVIAGPGDTLWSLAVEIAPESDPRPVVAALIEANGGESVQIGQQIVIPGQLLD